MNKGLKIVIGIVVIIIVIWLITANTNKSSDTNTIRVGIIAPLTGTAAPYGTEGKNSVVMALDEINEAGGIKDKKIQYFIEDGKCEAKAALDAWNKLVTVNKVEVVFGGHCSTESLAIAPLSARDRVPVLAVFVTAPTVENEGEWLFRHISTNTYYGSVLANEACKKGYRRTALITEQRDFPSSYSDIYKAEFGKCGGTVVLDERFAPDVTDYRSMALKLRGLNYDSIFVSTQGPQTMALITKQIKELGLEKPFLYNHAFSYVTFNNTTGGYLPPEYLVVQSYTDPNSPKAKAFDDAYTAKYGSLYKAIARFFIAADYDMVNRFKDAAEKCTNESLDVDCLRNEFKNAKSYSGAAGDVVISSKYSPYSVITPMGTLKIVDGKEVLTPIK